MVVRGHQVWVYQSSRHPFAGQCWKGVRLIRQPDPEDRLGTFGQFVYDFFCLLDARRRGFDILLQLGYTSNAIWFMAWPSGPVNIIHMDGLEWKRTKYSLPVRHFLRWMERLAACQGDVLVSDSKAISSNLESSCRRFAEYIPYGAPAVPARDEKALARFEVDPGQYYLAIARMVPENNLEPVIEGALDGEGLLPILVVGDTDTRNGRYLKNRYGGNGRVRFPGGIFEPDVLNSLRSFARLYFHGHSVGGTNPSLLEAMACGVPICAHDNVFNRSVLEEQAFYFKTSGDISRLLAGWPHHQERAKAWAEQNRQKAKTEYSWQRVADSYEALFFKHAKPKISI